MTFAARALTVRMQAAALFTFSPLTISPLVVQLCLRSRSSRKHFLRCVCGFCLCFHIEKTKSVAGSTRTPGSSNS
jgi:hypothetical protein